MECSSPEAVISHSDGTFLEALLERRGSRKSRDPSPKDMKTSEDSPSAGLAEGRCFVTFNETPEILIDSPREDSEISQEPPQAEVEGDYVVVKRDSIGSSCGLMSDDQESFERQGSLVSKGSKKSILSRQKSTDDGEKVVRRQSSLNSEETCRRDSTAGKSEDALAPCPMELAATVDGMSRKSSLRSTFSKVLAQESSLRSNDSKVLTRQSSIKSGSSGFSSRQSSFIMRKGSWRYYRFTRSKSQGVEMVPESGGLTTAQESASQAAQEILISSPGSNKARQKKFHRHFKTVPPDEKVLNYYSCALVADILLQGHLYITRNYFAFYSNVFGYVTKLLIPTSSVIKVTKEKTAYIIPNAVGVTTEDDKHVFGSLLSRDSTYKLMVQVWNAALAPTPSSVLSKPECLEDRLKDEELEEPILQDEESSLSGSESNIESKLISTSVDPLPKGNTQQMGLEVKSYNDMFSQTTPGSRAPFLSFLRALPRPTLLLIISTGLLILLFLSAAVLLYRIARLHQTPIDFSSRSMREVHAYINTNLEHITKVRESLEKLSFLIQHGGKYHS